MSSLRAKIIRSASSAYIKRLNVTKIDVDKIRRVGDRLGKIMMTAVRVRVESDSINGLYAEWLTPRDRIEGKVLLVVGDPRGVLFLFLFELAGGVPTHPKASFIERRRV